MLLTFLCLNAFKAEFFLICSLILYYNHEHMLNLAKVSDDYSVINRRYEDWTGVNTLALHRVKNICILLNVAISHTVQANPTAIQTFCL